MLPVARISEVWTKRIPKSELAERERAEAALAVQRLARGVYEGKIRFERSRQALNPIAETAFDGSFTTRSGPDAEHLLQAAANARKEADDAGIPAEPFDYNLATEFAKLIDEVLGEQ